MLVPVLGDHYGRVLEAGELQLVRERRRVHRPLRRPRAAGVAADARRPRSAAAAERAGSAELAELADGARRAPAMRRLTDRSGRRRTPPRQGDARASALRALCDDDRRRGRGDRRRGRRAQRRPRRASTRCSSARTTASRYWRTASEELDYRRFFDITTPRRPARRGPEVFADTHALVLDLVRDGQRRRPAHRPRRRAARPGGLPRSARRRRPAAPTSSSRRSSARTSSSRRRGRSPAPPGYDFLDRVDEPVRRPGDEARDHRALRTTFTGDDRSSPRSSHAAQAPRHARGARRRGRAPHRPARPRLRRPPPPSRPHPPRAARRAARGLAGFAVYRTYVEPGTPATPTTIAPQIAARRRPRRRAAGPTSTPSCSSSSASCCSASDRGAAGARAAPCASSSSPRRSMAKGVEDTAFYRYNRLVSLNEVGGDPGVFGRPVDDFHDAHRRRRRATGRERCSTLSTHDTKRSDDVRARLDVLSEMPGGVGRGRRRAGRRSQRPPPRGGDWPDRNAEYLLYQTLVGAWPIDADRARRLHGEGRPRGEGPHVVDRPDPAYDDARRGASSRGVLGRRRLRRRARALPRAHRLVERGRRDVAGPERAAADLPRRARHLPGHRAVGPEPGRPRQPPAGRLRARAAPARRASSDATRRADVVRAEPTHGVPKLLADPPAARPPPPLHPTLYASAAYEPLAVDGADGPTTSSRSSAAARRDRRPPARARPRAATGPAPPSTLPAGRWANVAHRRDAVDGGDGAPSTALLGRVPGRRARASGA